MHAMEFQGVLIDDNKGNSFLFWSDHLLKEGFLYLFIVSKGILFCFFFLLYSSLSVSVLTEQSLLSWCWSSLCCSITFIVIKLIDCDQMGVARGLTENPEWTKGHNTSKLGGVVILVMPVVMPSVAINPLNCSNKPHPNETTLTSVTVFHATVHLSSSSYNERWMFWLSLYSFGLCRLTWLPADCLHIIN